ncbi:MAG: adenosylcobinamide-phosphate synthase CbiB [Nitrospirota bacterium]
MAGLIILIAFILDLVFGDPRWLPHPVRLIGRLIQRTEIVLRRFAKTPKAEKAAGVILVMVIVLPVYFLSSLLILSASSFSLYLGFAVSALMAYTTLAARGLADAARAVLTHLNAGDIKQAGKQLSLIVGRDTENLEAKEITRAVVETVAENASDGVVAPLFYMALGGPALAMAYKAVNTLDSMVGYKNARYINFGRAAARLDDAANFIPARITAVLICLASGLLRRLKPAATPSPPIETFEGRPQPSPPRGEGDSAFLTPWRVMLRDCRNHPSPNSGWPEAAMAGALGVRLGGQSTYGGRLSRKPFIGNGPPVPDKKDVEKSLRLMYCASLFAALGAAAVNL